MENLEKKEKIENRKVRKVKPIFSIFGFLIIILLLSYSTIWQFKKWKENLPKEIPKIKIEEFEKIPELFSPENFPFSPETPEGLPFLENIPFLKNEKVSQTAVKSKEFVSSDGRLKIQYPANWLELETNLLEKAVPENLVKNYKLKFLFLAQKFGSDKSAQLIITEMTINSRREIQEIINEIKNTAKAQGKEMEIIFSESKEKEFIFEAIYKKEGTPTLHSKDRMLTFPLNENQNKIFWIEIIALDKDWGYLKEEIEKILEGAEIVK